MTSSAAHLFVTGGGSGIGLACARAFADDGAAITLAGRNRDKLKAATAQLTDEFPTLDIAWVHCDVTDEESVAAAVDAADKRQPLSCALANAGLGSAEPFLDTATEDWNRVLQTNLSGTFFTFKHAGRVLRTHGGGALCAISSIAGLRTHKFMSAYCASKAAIDRLVQNTADELGAVGIRVNSVCPGLVETEISAGLRHSEAMTKDYLSCMPIARIGQPEDVAQAVHFLCGPRANWITGVVLPVDGGHHLRRGPNLEVLLGA